jgi:hypothetical protein
MTVDALQEIRKSYLNAYGEVAADERKLSAGLSQRSDPT